MSGIFGIFQKDNTAVEPCALLSIQSAMSDWGPEGQHLWCEGGVGLGHLLLEVSPVSRFESLPSCHVLFPNLVISADARIDNRAELCDTLRINASERACMPDSTLILHAFARWGTVCPQYLLGAYAFVIWDRQTHQLFCARDHMGFRPFYYYESAQRFIFASAIKGVLAVAGVPRSVDPELLFAARFFGSRDLKDRTPLCAIAKLAPASTLTLSATRRQVNVYWRANQAPDVRFQRVDQYADALYEQVQRSVVACVDTNLPIGAHLSGGLDSSCVTVIANRYLRGKGRQLTATYSWSPPPQPKDCPLQDERSWVELICTQEAIKCQYTELSATSQASIQGRDISLEPTETLLFEAVVAAKAQAQGIRVLLSGWGGDEVVTFNGRGHLAGLLVQGCWRALGQEISWRKKRSDVSVFSLLKSEVVFPFLPASLYAWFYPSQLVKRQQGLTSQQKRVMQRNLERFRPCVGGRRTQLKLLDNAHITHRIEAWADFAANHQIDYRYPLLDRRLLEFCLGLPIELSLHHGWKRYLFRVAMQDVLPKEVAWRESKRDPAYLSHFASTEASHKLSALS